MDQIVSFPGIGIGEFTINRVAFSMFGYPIYWYGVIIAAAFLLGVGYILWRVRLFGLDADRVLDVILGGVIGGIVGARLYYVIFSWSQYKDNLLDIFNIRSGGIAIYGGVIGGFLVGFLMCKLRRVKFLPMADLAVGGLILGQGIGRWGNFINVEAFGSNTTLLWGMKSPSITAYLTANQAMLAAQGITVDPAMAVHPTFFYESIWCLLGFVLIVLMTKRRRFDGELTLIYAAWYGLGRAVIEGLRTDSLMWGSMRVSQVLAAVLVVVAMAVLVYVRASIKKSTNPDYLKLYVNSDEGQAVLSGQFYRRRRHELPTEMDETAAPSAHDAQKETDSEPLVEAGESDLTEPETTDGEDENNESKAD